MHGHGCCHPSRMTIIRHQGINLATSFFLFLLVIIIIILLFVKNKLIANNNYFSVFCSENHR